MTSSRIPPEHQEAMVAAYLAGDSLAKAAGRFGYGWKACWNALKRHGIAPRSQLEASRIPPADEEAMIQLYLAGASTIEAAQTFGFSPQTCTNVLRRRGITVRTRAEVCRRYGINETFFDTIATEQQSYWLGFLTADGAVVRNQLIVVLQARDAAHLAKLNAALDSSYPVQSRVARLGQRTYEQAALIINSRRLIAALDRLGIGPNKSLTVEPCVAVPDHLLADYWRGVVDGDGSIQPGRYPTVELTGSEKMVAGFHQFASTQVPNNAAVRPTKRVYRVRYGGSTARGVANLLYSTATVALDRKLTLAHELVAGLPD